MQLLAQKHDSAAYLAKRTQAQPKRIFEQGKKTPNTSVYIAPAVDLSTLDKLRCRGRAVRYSPGQIVDMGLHK